MIESIVLQIYFLGTYEVLKLNQLKSLIGEILDKYDEWPWICALTISLNVFPVEL